MRDEAESRTPSGLDRPHVGVASQRGGPDAQTLACDGRALRCSPQAPPRREPPVRTADLIVASACMYPVCMRNGHLVAVGENQPELWRLAARSPATIQGIRAQSEQAALASEQSYSDAPSLHSQIAVAATIPWFTTLGVRVCARRHP
ncbi:hypothetical protein WOLCODRAFT_158951 [Wolfiporia cocos MD-104 SS10]|uniref:Uncharacterized protein n=1 Tax=Wolfiporia cocos (strain MD-104) TaxID=742152 RepID=A0A2H3JKQ5_WOLCO|nr:hypothetical protein WOLCODRAFT_158951 [Wolfiporia cocos MD-104 SS10]